MPEAGNGIACRLQWLDPKTRNIDIHPYEFPDAVCVMTFVSELDKDTFERLLARGHLLTVASTVFYAPKDGKVYEYAAGQPVEPFSSIHGRSQHALVRWVCDVFDTIDSSQLHAVEVFNQSNRPAPTRKDRSGKPWTREDLHTVILMNLSDARKYGHRVDRGGSHASPSPHTRRGHYLTLRHARYGKHVGERRWRKPAWVGDTEWIFEGRQYRVIPPAV
jgi:hypothetical protein